MTSLLQSRVPFLGMSKVATTVEMTPRRAVGLMVHRSADLIEEKHTALQQVCQLHPQVPRVCTLLQQFAQIVRERRGEELDQWRQAAFHSGIPEPRWFVVNLRQDQEAVQAGLTLMGKNGMVEGQINPLKLLKRSMYGRADPVSSSNVCLNQLLGTIIFFRCMPLDKLSKEL